MKLKPCEIKNTVRILWAQGRGMSCLTIFLFSSDPDDNYVYSITSALFSALLTYLISCVGEPRATGPGIC